MDFAKILNFIREKDYLISEHADEERTKDELTIKELEQAILSGRIIEERLEDTRGESFLIAGESKKGKLIHIVIGFRFGRPLIVTVYTPSEKLWIHGTIRKKGKHD